MVIKIAIQHLWIVRIASFDHLNELTMYKDRDFEGSWVDRLNRRIAARSRSIKFAEVKIFRFHAFSHVRCFLLLCILFRSLLFNIQTNTPISESLHEDFDISSTNWRNPSAKKNTDEEELVFENNKQKQSRRPEEGKLKNDEQPSSLEHYQFDH